MEQLTNQWINLSSLKFFSGIWSWLYKANNWNNQIRFFFLKKNVNSILLLDGLQEEQLWEFEIPKSLTTYATNALICVRDLMAKQNDYIFQIAKGKYYDNRICGKSTPFLSFPVPSPYLANTNFLTLKVNLFI